MSIDYFYSLTPREFVNISNGVRKRKDIEYRNDWERTRLLIFYGLMPYKPKHGTFTPQSIIAFPWEKEEIPELSGTEVTEEQYIQMLDSWAVIDAKRKAKADC